MEGCTKRQPEIFNDVPLTPGEDEIGPVVGAYAEGPGPEYNRLDRISFPSVGSAQEQDLVRARAIPMDEASVLDIQVAPIDTTAAQRRKEYMRKREKCILVCVIGLIILVAFVAFVPTILFYPGSKQGEEDTPGIDPLSQSQSAALSLENQLLSLLPEYTQQSIERDRTSPQAKAYQWIKKDPNLTRYSTERIIQRFALGALYYSTNGYDWIHNTNWMSYSVHECEWHAQDILKIMGDIDRKGTVSAMVANDILPYLKAPTPCQDAQQYSHLWLAGNQLQGALPPELGLLTSLKTIILFANRLTGSLPTEIMVVLSDLETFDLAGNGLAGAMPTEIGLLSSLQTLVLSNNEMSGTIPTELGLLSNNLQLLAWAENQLTGTIPGFSPGAERIGPLQQPALWNHPNGAGDAKRIVWGTRSGKKSTGRTHSIATRAASESPADISSGPPVDWHNPRGDWQFGHS